MDIIKQEIEARRDKIVDLRREFHRHPELSFEEKWTSGVIAEELRQYGLDEVKAGVGGYGVVATLQGGKPGRVVMVRADIDGLPIVEQNSANYTSENRGVMHACGHDGHAAIALTLAAALAARKDEIPGVVKFAFQPAEERGAGALPMLKEGIMSGPEVDAVVGLHLWNNIPAGQLGVCNGPIFAGADTLEITVKGRGGHGALPHQTVDATIVGAQIVVALQTIVSRETAPLLSSVVTVGSFQSGSASNIISEQAKLAVSIRSATPEERQFLLDRVEQLAQGVAKAMRAECEFLFRPGIPPVKNNPEVADVVRKASRDTLGAANTLDIAMTTVSDDMSYFLEAKPGCYFLMGSGNSHGGETFPHHHPRFDLDESCLLPAVEVMARSVFELSQK